jgi:hypothetical protein
VVIADEVMRRWSTEIPLGAEDFLRHESLSWLSLLTPDLSKATGALDRLGSSLELEQRFEDFLTGAMPMGLHHALCRIDAGCPHRRHDRGVFLD